MKNTVPLVLRNSQITLCDIKRGMIIQIHQKNRRNSLFPCMIAKCFAQGMAADVLVLTGFLGGFADDPPRLTPADRLVDMTIGAKQVFLTLLTVITLFQCGYNAIV